MTLLQWEQERVRSWKEEKEDDERKLQLGEQDSSKSKGLQLDDGDDENYEH